MNLAAKLIFPQVVHINVDSQYFLASTFIRIQEFYESPFENIRNKEFLLEDYMDTEVRNNGKFDYFTKWAGFNIPSHVFKKFFNTFYDVYEDTKEDKLLRYVSALVNWKKPFYIIGTYESTSIDHELAHAFYYLSSDYKKKMNALIAEIEPVRVFGMMKELSEMGYCEEVYHDEIQAYASTERHKVAWVNADVNKAFREVLEAHKLKLTKENV